MQVESSARSDVPVVQGTWVGQIENRIRPVSERLKARERSPVLLAAFAIGLSMLLTGAYVGYGRVRRLRVSPPPLPPAAPPPPEFPPFNAPPPPSAPPPGVPPKTPLALSPPPPEPPALPWDEVDEGWPTWKIALVVIGLIIMWLVLLYIFPDLALCICYVLAEIA